MLPVSLAFAGSAMLAVVVLELAPQAFSRKSWKSGVAGALTGDAAVLLLSALLGV